MGELILFEDFVTAHAHASREEFLAQVAQPHLLFTGLELDHEAETGFETRQAESAIRTPRGTPRLSGLAGVP